MDRRALNGLVAAAVAMSACGAGGADNPSTSVATADSTAAPSTTSAESTTTTTPTEPDDPTVAWTGAPEVAPVSVADFPEAGSISAVVAPDGRIHLGLGIGASIHHATSRDGASFSEPVAASEEHAFVLAFEPPALFVEPDGTTWVAHPTAELDGSIVVSRSDDGGATFTTLGSVSGPPAFETILPRFAARPDGRPALSWLADSTLRLLPDPATGDDPTVIDDRTCECCNPAPVFVGDSVAVAYRDLDNDGTGVHRDIAVAVSSDGGATFGSPVQVSDRHWYLDACPISGPAAVTDGENLHVLWMDGRNDDGSFRYTDIWLATSTDGGSTFTPDRRVNAEAGIYHGQPVAAFRDGVVHVVWDSRNGVGGEALHYSMSADGGSTFTEPVVLTGTALGSGARPGNATLTIDDANRIVVTWVDGNGSHIGVWSVG